MSEKHADSQGKKLKGWFSWRHQTDEAHLTRQADRLVRLEAKKTDALERQQHRNGLTPQEQLDRLDERLGKDMGATKERAKLHKLLSK